LPKSILILLANSIINYLELFVVIVSPLSSQPSLKGDQYNVLWKFDLSLLIFDINKITVIINFVKWAPLILTVPTIRSSSGTLIQTNKNQCL